MRAPARLVLPLLVALLGGGAAWLLLGRTADDDAERTTRAPRAAATETLPTGPALEGLAAPGERVRARPPWTLDVVIAGLEEPQPPAVALRVDVIGKLGQQSLLEASIPAGERRASIDVSALHDQPLTHTLFVMADAPGYAGGAARLELPEESEARARGGVLEARLALRRIALVVGRVVGPDGRPLPAQVALVGDGGAYLVRGGDPRTDEEGRFRLSVDPDVAFRVHAGELPYGHGRVTSECLLAGPFRAGMRETLDLGTLELPRGHTLEVRLRGHLDGASRVVATPTGFPDCLPGWGHTLDSSRDAYRWASREGARRGSGGEFELAGLGAGLWSVRAQVADWGCAGGHEFQWACSAFVPVPGPGIELDVRRALQRVVVRDDDGPVESAVVVLEDEHALAFTTDAAGHGAVVLRPRTRYRVRVVGPQHVLAATDVLTAADGEEDTLEVSLVRGARSVPEDLDWTHDPVTSLTLRVLEGDEAGGTYVPARLRVEDAAGARVPLRWVVRSNVVTWLMTDRLLALGDAHCVDAPPPGDLTFIAEGDGLEPARTTLRRGAFASRGAQNVLITMRRR